MVQGKEELRRQLEQQEKQIGELKNELKEKSARQRMMEKATEEMESINEELSEKVKGCLNIEQLVNITEQTSYYKPSDIFSHSKKRCLMVCSNLFVLLY